jgi:hypothetical protein
MKRVARDRVSERIMATLMQMVVLCPLMAQHNPTSQICHLLRHALLYDLMFLSPNAPHSAVRLPLPVTLTLLLLMSATP